MKYILIILLIIGSAIGQNVITKSQIKTTTLPIYIRTEYYTRYPDYRVVKAYRNLVNGLIFSYRVVLINGDTVKSIWYNRNQKYIKEINYFKKDTIN